MKALVSFQPHIKDQYNYTKKKKSAQEFERSQAHQEAESILKINIFPKI